MASTSKPVPAKTPAGRPDTAPKVAAASPPPRTATPQDSKTVKPAKPAPTPRKRARIRISHDGGPVATWISLTERPRSSSFIPAPPRASSPDLIAAPPASSDRLVDPTDLVGIADYRTVPVRVEIERSSGRIYISVNPEAAELHPGDGIEWDFRYLGGSDIEVQEVVIEFSERTPFSAAAFRSQKPGNARPHRQISGPSTRDGSGTAVEYVIRCINAYKTELATTTAQASFA